MQPREDVFAVVEEQPCQGWGRGFASLRPLQAKSNQALSSIPKTRVFAQGNTGVTAVEGLRFLPSYYGAKTKKSRSNFHDKLYPAETRNRR